MAISPRQGAVMVCGACRESCLPGAPRLSATASPPLRPSSFPQVVAAGRPSFSQAAGARVFCWLGQRQAGLWPGNLGRSSETESIQLS
jgi:hypothetical protein